MSSDEAEPRAWIDRVLDDEFPLSLFYISCRRSWRNWPRSRRWPDPARTRRRPVVPCRDGWSAHDPVRLAERFALGGTQTAALETYVDLVLGWTRANLTGLRSREEIVEKLLGDSLALLDVPQVRERAGAGWLDLGAGAGIPGIPLAVALPAVELTLLEAVASKCEFLEAAVHVGRHREPRARGSARAARATPPPRPAGTEPRVVLARAVAPLPVLVELAAPLLAQGGAPAREQDCGGR